MAEKKLCWEEVPKVFAKWLLSMGCPAEIVPSEEKVSQICRGQYYMVWRSMMEHVQPKDVTRSKRLQVFVDDIRKCQKKNVFNEVESNAVVPEQLVLWKEQTELTSKVSKMEDRVRQTRQNLDQLLDNVSSKMAQRLISRQRVDELRRRTYLLQQVADELRCKKANLEETKSIADSLCTSEDSDIDIQDKLDQYMTIVSRQSNQARHRFHPTAKNLLSSTILTTKERDCEGTQNNNIENCEEEEILSSLSKCRGEVLWKQLHSRRADINAGLARASTLPIPATDDKCTPQSVLAHTAALHCTMALGAMRHRILIKNTNKKLAAAIEELSNLDRESCELLVLRCERTGAEARVNSLKTLVDEMTSRRGVFDSFVDVNAANTTKKICDIDKAIVSKRDELKSTISCILMTERKIERVRQSLVSVFNGFNKDRQHMDITRFTGVDVKMPQESIASLTSYYQERRAERKKVELSFNLEMSDCSVNDFIDTNNPRFIDELKIYLKNFSLEKNRKLVMESGEKMWVFETFQSSLQGLYKVWLDAGLSCSLVCPSVSLSANVKRLVDDINSVRSMEAVLRRLDCSINSPMCVDISKTKEEEQQVADKIKKRLNENLLILQKTTKALDLGHENLRIWSDNEIKKYISMNRTVNGKTYRDVESDYVAYLK